MSAPLQAAITAINEQRPGGWRDQITVWDADGEAVDTIEVEPSEEPGPYDAAIRSAGYAITGTAARQHVHGGDGWLLAALGEGILDWPSAERVSDRYGRVNLESGSGYVGWDAAIEGMRGTLAAEITQARQSGHIGDFCRGIGPSTPEVGEKVTLGTGTVFLSMSYGAPCIGLRPDDGRESDWLDPRALYRCHNQTVRLTFTPESAS